MSFRSRIAGIGTSIRRRINALTAIDSRGGWLSLIRESFGGAWQQGIVLDGPRNLFTFSPIFACTDLISGDIGKCRPMLKRRDENGIYVEVEDGSPFLQILRKPNHFQNWIQFIETWVLSKLFHGNTYAYKERDGRGMVSALYVLDPTRVTPLVAESGDVYYRLSRDDLSGLGEGVTVPASEIIHDRGITLWHPLMGVSPIYACAMSGTMGNRIQANSATFFENMSRPSGMLSAPAKIDPETAERLKRDWNENYAGKKIGKLAVLGDGLTYLPMTITATDAQLIEQLKWTVEDCARAFHMPLYKIGGPLPARESIELLNQNYYSDCLQRLIESIELCLGLGLALPSGMEIELDLDALLRMDSAARFTKWNDSIKGGWMKPNEARAKEDMQPVSGGDQCYLQQQNFSLAALAKRDALPNPFVIDKPTPNPTPSVDGPAPVADPNVDPNSEAQAAEMANVFILGLLEPEEVA